MIKEDIKIQLDNWFSQITKKYAWLRIKFEFNEERGVFMVSFSPSRHIELSDEFNADAMRFSDEMNALYGNEAPLFTDEENLFTLSSDAEVIAPRSFMSVGCPSPYSTSTPALPHRPTGIWASSSTCTTAPANKNFRQTQPEATYAFAA